MIQCAKIFPFVKADQTVSKQLQPKASVWIGAFPSTLMDEQEHAKTLFIGQPDLLSLVASLHTKNGSTESRRHILRSFTAPSMYFGFKFLWVVEGSGGAVYELSM